MRLLYGEGKENAIERLVEEITQTKRRKTRILIEAIERNIEGDIKRLLEEGAEASSIGLHQDHPIHVVIRLGHAKAVKVLLDYGAFSNCVPLCSIQTAMLLPDREIERMLLEALIPRAINKKPDGGDGIFWATYDGDIERVYLLLEDGENVNSQGLWRFTPLTWAAAGGYTDIVDLMLTKGAIAHIVKGKQTFRPDPVDEPYVTPLLIASDRGQADTVRPLLRAGAFDPLEIEDAYIGSGQSLARAQLRKYKEIEDLFREIKMNNAYRGETLETKSQVNRYRTRTTP